MNRRYPAAAAAFAMIFCTETFRQAWVAGILFICTGAFSYLLKGLLTQVKANNYLSKTVMLLGTGGFSLALFYIVYTMIPGMTADQKDYLVWTVLGFLLGIYFEWTSYQKDYDDILYCSALAYGLWILLAMVREFLSAGQLFGYQLAQFPVMSKGLQTAIFGFLLAGIAMGILNHILRTQSGSRDSLLVICPALLLAIPFQAFENLEWLNWLLGIVVTGMMLYAAHNRIRYSWVGDRMKHLPITLISTGLIYMILTVV